MEDGNRQRGRRPAKGDCVEVGAGFVQVSRLIVYDNFLSPRAVRVYLAVVDYCWEGRTTSFPSQRLVSAKLGCSIDTVQRGIGELRDRGLIFISKWGLPSKNRYHFIRAEKVYSQEEIAFVADHSKLAEEWETRRITTKPKPYEPPESTDDPDEGYEETLPKSNEVPEAANLRLLHTAEVRPAHAAGLRSKADEPLPLRGREKQTKQDKSPASPDHTPGDCPLSSSEGMSTLDPLFGSDREKAGTGRQRTYASPLEDRSYGMSPSGVHEAFAEAPDPEPVVKAKTRPKTPQGGPSGLQMPSYDMPTSPRPVVTQPPVEVAEDNFAKLYSAWRTEIVSVFKAHANDIPVRPPRDFKLRSCGTSLLAKFEGVTPDGRPGFDTIIRLIRVAAWDWEGVKVHEGSKWVAKGLPFPTIREIHLLSDFLCGHTQTGVVAGANHRVSNYHQKFIQPPPPLAPTDKVGEIAAKEGKTRASVLREMKAGRDLG